jgi:hypothetical protein
MRIGVPKEIKNHEYRVGLTPAGAHMLSAAGHEVRVEARAGTAVGFDDAAYRAAGAQLVATAAEAYASDLVIKVKELQPAEFALTHPGQIAFGFVFAHAGRRARIPFVPGPRRGPRATCRRAWGWARRASRRAPPAASGDQSRLPRHERRLCRRSTGPCSWSRMLPHRSGRQSN